MKSIALLAALLCCSMPALADDLTNLAIDVALGAAMDHLGVNTLIKNEINKPQVERRVAEYKFNQVVPPLYVRIHTAKLDNAVRVPMAGKIDDIARQSKCVPVNGQWKWNCNASDTATLNRTRELGEKLAQEIEPEFAKEDALDRQRAEVAAQLMRLSDKLDSAPLLKNTKPAMLERLNQIVKFTPCVRQPLNCSIATPEGLEFARTSFADLNRRLDDAVHTAFETKRQVKELVDEYDELGRRVGRQPNIGQDVQLRLHKELDKVYATAGFVFGPGGANYSDATLESVAKARPLLAAVRQELDKENFQAQDTSKNAQEFAARAETLQERIQHVGLARDAQGRLRQRLEQLLGHAKCMGGQHIDCSKAKADGLKTAHDALAALWKDVDDEARMASNTQDAAKPFAVEASQLRDVIHRAPIAQGAQEHLQNQLEQALNGVPCGYGQVYDCSRATPAGLKAGKDALNVLRKELSDEVNKAERSLSAAKVFAADAAQWTNNIVRAPYVSQETRQRLTQQLDKALETAKCIPGQTPDCSKATAESLKAGNDALNVLRKDLSDEANKAERSLSAAKVFAADAAQWSNSIVRAPYVSQETRQRLTQQLDKALETAKCTPGQTPDCSKATAESLKAGNDALNVLRKELGDEVHKADVARQLGNQFASEAASASRGMLGNLKTASTKDGLMQEFKLMLKDAGCSEHDPEPDCSQTTAEKMAAGQKALAKLREDVGRAINAERAQQQ